MRCYFEKISVPLQRVITLLYMNRIESILKEKGIKKIRFAEMMDINKQNVNQLFRNPTLNTLEKIADVLDVPVWQLLVSPEALNASSEKENEMVCPHCGKPIKVGLSKA